MAELVALEDEFALTSQFIWARSTAGLTQHELAVRMKTSQSYIARLEAGKETPSSRTLNRFAKATGHRVVINCIDEDQDVRKNLENSTGNY
ncbi:MAG: helix-turn-helix transcriptional regulator [Gammaproteobacteria bacterium]|nr:helix-turn-helix transcriptional regulator [Gammaproteobacteria bacterium]MCY4228170.1 helix-turn-helix transcriptional regulator [Gammaproteobacteria bacterium]MCY4314316.1 helix-turn-helix transcriptional regulator [Gammaproteobacteria bacterium]